MTVALLAVIVTVGVLPSWWQPVQPPDSKPTRCASLVLNQLSRKKTTRKESPRRCITTLRTMAAQSDSHVLENKRSDPSRGLWADERDDAANGAIVRRDCLPVVA